jgi:DNA-binding CsgD family transcriptional regulator
MRTIQVENDRDENIEIVNLLRFSIEATHLSSAVFYWVDDRTRMNFVAVEGVDQSRLNLYQSTFYEHDPCSPSRMIDLQIRTQTLAQASSTLPNGTVELYRPYMNFSGIRDSLEMLFWCDGRAIAGMGLIAREGDAPCIPLEVVKLAGSMQSYIETSLLRHPHVVRERARHRLLAHYMLSPRELAVASLVCRGLTNVEIAEELSISLPTVKSHLQNMFEKMGVSNRASLISEVQQIGMVH